VYSKGEQTLRTPPVLGISEQSVVFSCELRRKVKEIGENIANKFDYVKNEIRIQCAKRDSIAS
jgi:hypothetical protein